MYIYMGKSILLLYNYYHDTDFIGNMANMLNFDIVWTPVLLLHSPLD